MENWSNGMMECWSIGKIGSSIAGVSRKAKVKDETKLIIRKSANSQIR